MPPQHLLRLRLRLAEATPRDEEAEPAPEEQKDDRDDGGHDLEPLSVLYGLALIDDIGPAEGVPAQRCVGFSIGVCSLAVK